MTRARSAVVGLVLLGAVVVGLGWILWPMLLPRLIYAPRTLEEAHRAPATWGYEGQEVTFASSTGDTLHGWLLHDSSAEGNGCTILFLHGNAGNVSSQSGFMRPFLAAGFKALVFDYRGYGASGGAPSEEGLYADSEAAYRFLVDRVGVPQNRLVIVGHSLGTAVATWLASRYEAGAVVLAAPFASLPDAMNARVRWIPVSALRWPRERFDSGSRIRSISAPKLFVMGAADRLVPRQSAMKLYEAASAPKRWVDVPGGHNAVFSSTEFRTTLQQSAASWPMCAAAISQ